MIAIDMYYRIVFGFQIWIEKDWHYLQDKAKCLSDDWLWTLDQTICMLGCLKYILNVDTLPYHWQSHVRFSIDQENWIYLFKFWASLTLFLLILLNFENSKFFFSILVFVFYWKSKKRKEINYTNTLHWHYTRPTARQCF